MYVGITEGSVYIYIVNVGTLGELASILLQDLPKQKTGEKKKTATEDTSKEEKQVCLTKEDQRLEALHMEREELLQQKESLQGKVKDLEQWLHTAMEAKEQLASKLQHYCNCLCISEHQQ